MIWNITLNVLQNTFNYVCIILHSLTHHYQIIKYLESFCYLHLKHRYCKHSYFVSVHFCCCRTYKDQSVNKIQISAPLGVKTGIQFEVGTFNTSWNEDSARLCLAQGHFKSVMWFGHSLRRVKQRWDLTGEWKVKGCFLRLLKRLYI